MVRDYLDLRSLALLIRWDLMRLKNQKIFLAMRVTWFLVQAFVFARAVSYIVTESIRELIGVEYYYFYLLGIYASLLYTTGISRGYIIADEFDDGIVEYHLSLPIKRSTLALGRIIGCSLVSLIFTLPMMSVVLIAVYTYRPGSFNLASILISMLSAFLFSAGVVGFVVLLVMRLKSTDLTDIVIGAVDAFVVRLSTVFYPLPVVEASGIAPYYLAALGNPVSHFADFLRLVVFPEYELVVRHGALASLVYVAGLAMGFLILAIEYYEKRLEAGGWR